MKKFDFSDDDFKMSSFTFLNPHKACVMIARKNKVVAVRNSKDPSRATLIFTEKEWDAFIKGVKAGEFDL